MGYPITIAARTRQGCYQTIDLEIVGIVNTPNPIINRNAVFILFFVFVIAAVVVSNTVFMSILERTREFGAMRALGMRTGEVTATLLVEAAGIVIAVATAFVPMRRALKMDVVDSLRAQPAAELPLDRRDRGGGSGVSR